MSVPGMLFKTTNIMNSPLKLVKRLLYAVSLLLLYSCHETSNKTQCKNSLTANGLFGMIIVEQMVGCPTPGDPSAYIARQNSAQLKNRMLTMAMTVILSIMSDMKFS